MNYKIIEFDDGLSIIPINWIDQDEKKCKWPPYKTINRINKAIEKMETPTTEWDTWIIKKIYANAKNIEDANEKLRLAEHQSDVEAITQDPMVYKRTRKDRAKVDPSYESTDEEPTRINKNKRKDDVLQRLQVPILRASNDQQIDEGALGELVLDIASEVFTNGSTTSSAVVDKSHWNAEGQIINTDSEVLTNGSTTSSGVVDKTNWNAEGLIIAHLTELISISNKSLLILKNIENNMNPKTIKRSQNVDWSSLLPFKNFEDVLSFSTKLEVEHELVRATMEMLQGIGGRDDRSKINNIMDKIFTDRLGSTFSWKGQKGKHSLEKLKFGKVVFDAIMCCKHNFSETEIKAQLGSWLAGRKAKLDRQASKNLAANQDRGGTPERESF